MQEFKDRAGKIWQVIVAEPTPAAPGAVPPPPTTPKTIEEIRQLIGRSWQWIVAEPQPSSPGTGPSAGPSTGPATAPARRTAWDPDDLAGKSSDWVIAWHNAELRWDAVTHTIPSGNAPAIVLARFEGGMRLLHEDLFGARYRVENILNIRALADFLLPRIWTEPKFIERFFKDPQFNSVVSGLPKPQDFTDLPLITRSLYLPEHLRALPLLDDVQKRQLRQLYRRMALVLHPDTVNAEVNASQNLKDSVEDLNKVLHSRWNIVETLL